jgi:hypothetical protein
VAADGHKPEPLTVIHSFTLDDQRSVEELAQDVAMALEAGDLVFLEGDLGVGKTTMARAMIRAMAGDAGHEVPSPTFTIVQEYQDMPLPVAHLDLYRISGPDELTELGVTDWLETGVALVEWPENAHGALGLPTVEIRLEETSTDGRKIDLLGDRNVADRLVRSFKIRDFLNSNGKETANRNRLQGDSSARSYEIIDWEGDETRILMNSPPIEDNDVFYDGVPYRQAVHLAEDVRPFIAIGDLLQEKGFRVPARFGTDIENGFLLLEHLGRGSILDSAKQPIAQRYIACAEMLADFHHADWPTKTPIAGADHHIIPRYDAKAMKISVSLLPDWWGRENQLPDSQIMRLYELWNPYFERFQSGYDDLILRDFHSPNIIWQAGATGTDRVGLIDFQDALIGPGAYDLVSIVQDARVTIPIELQQKMLSAYCARSAELSDRFDQDRLLADVAILGAFRSSRLFGLWVRLDLRDGLPGYRQHAPRTRQYLEQSLEHPAVADLRQWYVENGVIGNG